MIEKLEVPGGVLLRDCNPGGSTIFFNSKTMRLFQVGEPHANEEINTLGSRFATSETLDRETLIPGGGVDPFLLKRRAAISPIYGRTGGIRPHVGRLTLNISNNCNLWCSYCYADHGFYHAPKSLMSSEDTVRVLDKILDLYGSIGTMHFFGGEPLMNLAAIDAAGQFFADACKSRRIAKLPEFVATTNGTLSSPRVISMLQKWNVSLTVSWDGPQPVHDKNRPTASGGSSFASLERSLRRFMNADIPYEIECTYSRSHSDAGLTIVDLLEYFGRNTGKRQFHIAAASLPDATKAPGSGGQRIFRDEVLAQQIQRMVPVDELTLLFEDAAKLTVDNFFSKSGPLLSLGEGVLTRILMQKPAGNYCPAFFSQLSIATDGSVYPCFMFIGDPSFRFGNILTDRFPTKESAEIFSRYFREFGLSPVGTNRWYAPLFSGCVAGDYIMAGNLSDRAMAPVYEAVISTCMLGVARYACSANLVNEGGYNGVN